jgi:hypothetical protein
MSPRLALAKPLTGSGHGSGALKKRRPLGRLFLMVQQVVSLFLMIIDGPRQANSLSYF